MAGIPASGAGSQDSAGGHGDEIFVSAGEYQYRAVVTAAGIPASAKRLGIGAN